MRKGLMISLICTGCAFGQAGEPGRQGMVHIADPMEVGPVGITTALAGPMDTVAGAPYSAQAVTERVQMLADGNRIEQTTSGSVARDSQGRIRRDETLPGLTASSGDAPRIVMIDDPVAQVHWTLDALTKTAMKMPAPNMKNGGFSALGVPPPPSATTKTFFYSTAAPPGILPGKVQVFTNIKGGPTDLNISESDLGTQTIEGVPAHGKRTTRTIPAGQVGNEQAIVITTESWYSPDLKVLVMSKSNDPRMGETTYKLTNIQRSEPAASLFQVPDDYTVRDQPGPNVMFHEIKKAQ